MKDEEIASLVNLKLRFNKKEIQLKKTRLLNMIMVIGISVSVKLFL